MLVPAISGVPLFTNRRTGMDVPISDVGWGPFINVKSDFGARGDGSTDDTTALQAAIDACFGPASSPNGGTNPQLNKILWIPSGIYMITKALKFRSVHGGKILGAGRFSTQIQQTTVGQSTMVTNGFEYNFLEGFAVIPASSADTAFDLNWDNTGDAALQSNTFANMHFGSPAASSGAIGLAIGAAGFMGSETTILNCFFGNFVAAGIKVLNFNALSQTVIGGNFQGCTKNGIWVLAGSCTNIIGCGFQNGANEFDIRIDNSADDVVNITGTRSESLNHCFLGSSGHSVLSAIEHLNNTLPNGTFLFLANGVGQPTDVKRCVSLRGQIFIGIDCRLSVKGSSFGRTDWITLPTTAAPGCQIEIEDVQYAGTPNDTGLLPATHITKMRIDDRGEQNYVTESYAALTSDNTLSDVNTVQAVFAVAGKSGIFALEAGVTYDFEAEYNITNTGTTSHTWAVLFGGTATFTTAMMQAIAVSNTGAAAVAAPLQGFTTTIGVAFVVTAASTSATENVSIQLKGRITVNAAGTFIPQVQLSAATTGTEKVLSGSYIKIKPVYPNDTAGLNFVGPWS